MYGCMCVKYVHVRRCVYVSISSVCKCVCVCVCALGVVLRIDCMLHIRTCVCTSSHNDVLQVLLRWLPMMTPSWPPHCTLCVLFLPTHCGATVNPHLSHHNSIYIYNCICTRTYSLGPRPSPLRARFDLRGR